MGDASGDEEAGAAPVAARPRLRIHRRPRMDEAVTIAQGRALVLTLRTMIVVLEDVGELDSREVADLLVAEMPIHAEPVVETFARLMVNDLVTQLRGGDPDRMVG